MAPSVAVRSFGSLPGGAQVEAWTLRGAGAMVAEVITYGATVTRLLVPDRHGRLADVVLGFDNLNSYRRHEAYFGATVGRVAGRISGARFCLDGQTYELTRNEGPNHLHGGREGFNKKNWDAQSVVREDKAPSLRLTYRSPDGEEGYPGTVDVTVTYTVTHDDILLVETEATADRPTPLSLTHHSYFNLGGDGCGSVADHELQICAQSFVATDEQMTLTGRTERVAGRDNDFRQARNLGEAIPVLFQNHGDLYALRESAERDSKLKAVQAARLAHPASGRVLEVGTTASYLQFYTGDALDGSLIGKSGLPYLPYAGLCLECEGYPDGANRPELGDIILRPGQSRRECTSYAFSVNSSKSS